MARQYLTPPSIPDDIYCRTLQIPNSPEWIGTLTGALYPLCFSEAWTQEAGGITPEEAAERFLEIFNAMFEGEGDCVAGCCTELRRDPNTGRIQTSTDGGLTWFDVAEGPWVDAPNVPITTTPPPLMQGSDAADRCLAAANATSVIAEFYRQTAGEAGAVLYNTILSMNMFLNELNNALLELAYPQAGRLLNASGFLDFDWGEYAEAPTLDPEAQNALQCLLYCNSSVTDGVVSFDFGAVYDNLIAELGINPGTAVTLLVGYMQEAGLNHAGGILANESAECDCPDCDDTWEHTFNFAEDDGGFTNCRIIAPDNNPFCGSSAVNPVYDGTYWVFTSNGRQAGRGFDRSYITSVSVIVGIEAGSPGPRAIILVLDRGRVNANAYDADNSVGGIENDGAGLVELNFDVEDYANEIVFGRCTSANKSYYHSVTIRGTGINPFV